jgi:hypothetical protein
VQRSLLDAIRNLNSETGQLAPDFVSATAISSQISMLLFMECSCNMVGEV